MDVLPFEGIIICPPVHWLPEQSEPPITPDMSTPLSVFRVIFVGMSESNELSALIVTCVISPTLRVFLLTVRGVFIALTHFPVGLQ